MGVDIVKTVIELILDEQLEKKKREEKIQRATLEINEKYQDMKEKKD